MWPFKNRTSGSLSILLFCWIKPKIIDLIKNKQIRNNNLNVIFKTYNSSPYERISLKMAVTILVKSPDIRVTSGIDNLSKTGSFMSLSSGYLNRNGHFLFCWGVGAGDWFILEFCKTLQFIGVAGLFVSVLGSNFNLRALMNDSKFFILPKVHLSPKISFISSREISIRALPLSSLS